MKSIITTTICLVLLHACSQPAQNPEQRLPSVNITENLRSSTIYEVNIRQYTEEGTLAAFSTHLPRLKELGVDILWLMPIQPIGEKNRKGPLGSYYSIKNYVEVNPEFGTLDDFKALVRQAHELDIKVILDWVANHTSFDHPWTEIEGFHTTKDGQIIHPEGTDWTDVADLNYENSDMRRRMIEDMSWWVTETDIDGFRCDVAGWVPLDFWQSAIDSLNEIKPMFMLAEANEPELHPHFQMTYAWDLHHQMNELAKGNIDASKFKEAVEKDLGKYPSDAMRMMFITNHDENSWNGTINERIGPDAHKAFATLFFTLRGMPLIYSGQEAGLNKRLRFFDKDTISWADLSLQPFYKQLINLKKNNEALHNGPYAGDLRFFDTRNDQILAYQRSANKNLVTVIINLSNETQSIHLPSDAFMFTDYFTKNDVDLNTQALEPNGYYVGIQTLKP